MRKKEIEIKDYDDIDTTSLIDPSKSMGLADLNLRLPKEGPTKVVSIRLPTNLLNKIKAFSSNNDIPYQAYIKYLLSKGIQHEKKQQKN